MNNDSRLAYREHYSPLASLCCLPHQERDIIHLVLSVLLVLLSAMA